MIFKGTISCRVCGTNNSDLQKSIIIQVADEDRLVIDCDNCKQERQKLKMDIRGLKNEKEISEFAEKFKQHWGEET